MNLQKGLVGHWTMDNADTSGGTLYDRSAYDNHGTLNGSVATGITSSPTGEAHSFDATNSYITMGDVSGTTLSNPSISGKLSVFYWVNRQQVESSNEYIISTGAQTDSNGFTTLAQGYVSVKDGTNEFTTSNADPLPTNSWVLGGFVWDGSTLKHYRDGTVVSTTTASPISTNDTATDLVVATSNNSQGNYLLNGYLSDVRVYNRCLSAEEVRALANMRSQQQSNTSRPINTTVNGKDVVLQRDSQGSWILVQNYEHYGGTNPSVGPGSTFPQLPNGLRTISDIQNAGSNGELRHVDNITQYGSWQVDAVRLEGVTSNHGRKIHFYSENQDVIDAVVNDSVPVGHSQLKDQVTKYPDHSAFLPDDMGADNDNETDDRSDRIFGHGFPMYGNGSDGTRVHWAVAGHGNRWEVDDYPSDASQTTIHRVWVRTGLFE